MGCLGVRTADNYRALPGRSWDRDIMGTTGPEAPGTCEAVPSPSQRACTPYHTWGTTTPPPNRIYLLLLFIVQHIYQLDHIPVPQPPQQLDLPATEDTAQPTLPAMRDPHPVTAELPSWEYTGH